MLALIFFLLGIPVAFLANRLVIHLTFVEEPEADEAAPAVVPEADLEGAETATRVVSRRKRLPWHGGVWAQRVRIATIALIPAAMAVAGWRFEPGQAVLVSLLAVGLIICTATDLLKSIVPNLVTYPGVLLAIVATLLLEDTRLAGALLAGLLGGSFFLAFFVFTRGAGMGLGDVKLAALIGVALGSAGAYEALFYGMAAGGVILGTLLLLKLVSMRDGIPYGPFLALAAVAVLLTKGAAFAPL